MGKKKTSSQQSELDLGGKSKARITKTTYENNKLKGRYETAYTALNIALQIFLSRRGLTAEQLADLVGANNVKTVERHIKQLKVLFHIYPQKIEGKTYYCVDEMYKNAAKQSEVLFSCLETVGLMHLQDYMLSLKGSAAVAPIRKAIKNILDNMPAPTREHYRNLKKKFFARLPAPSDYHGKENIIGMVNDAMTRLRPLQIHYHSFSSRRKLTRIIHPYRLEAIEGSLYVYGFDRHSKEDRLFKIDRILEAKTLEKEHFAIPGEFDFDKIRSASFSVFKGPTETITAIFDAKTAPYLLEKKWHASQTHEKLADGRLKVTWNVSGTRDIKRFLMGFCEHVVVIEPKELRAEIIQDAKKMLCAYGAESLLENPANLSEINLHLSRTRKTFPSVADEKRHTESQKR